MASVTAAAVFPSTPISTRYFEARSPQEIQAPRGIPPMIRSSSQSPTRPLASPIRRALGDVHPTGNMTASRVSPFPPVRLLPAAPQAPVKVPTRLSVRSHRWVDPFPPGHHLPWLLKPTRDGFRTPAFPQPVLDHHPAIRRHLPGHGRGFPTPTRRLPLGLLVTVPPLPAMAGQFPGNRADVPPEMRGHRSLGSTGETGARKWAIFPGGSGGGRQSA